MARNGLNKILQPSLDLGTRLMSDSCVSKPFLRPRLYAKFILFGLEN